MCEGLMDEGAAEMTLLFTSLAGHVREAGLSVTARQLTSPGRSV